MSTFVDIMVKKTKELKNDVFVVKDRYEKAKAAYLEAKKAFEDSILNDVVEEANSYLHRAFAYKEHSEELTWDKYLCVVSVDSDTGYCRCMTYEVVRGLTSINVVDCDVSFLRESCIEISKDTFASEFIDLMADLKKFL